MHFQTLIHFLSSLSTQFIEGGISRWKREEGESRRGLEIRGIQVKAHFFLLALLFPMACLSLWGWMDEDKEGERKSSCCYPVHCTFLWDSFFSLKNLKLIFFPVANNFTNKLVMDSLILKVRMRLMG